jgi:hypothetical protein
MVRPPPTPLPHPAGSAVFLAVWLCLNLLAQMTWPAREMHLTGLIRPSQELFGALWLLCFAARHRLRFSRAIAAALAALMIFTAVFRIADRLVPAYFDRPFNLFIDSRFLPDLLSLLYDTTAPAVFFRWSAAAATGVIIAFGLFYGGFRWMHRQLRDAASRIVFMTTAHLMLLFSLAWVLFAPSPNPGIFAAGVWPRISDEVGFIFTVERTRRRQIARMERAAKRNARLPSALDRLEGRDVLLLFVESYGETIFEDPRHFAIVAPALQRLESSPRFSACSTFLRSPTISGSSWLAHGAFSGGVMTDTHLGFGLLLDSNIKPLAHYFNRAGYRTVCVAPGTQTPRPEDAWFAFQQKYDASSLGYRGPAFGWSTMPDQFVLDRICREEIRTAETPLFIEFILVSSHAAFHCQPRFIEEADRIGDGSVFHEIPPRRFPVVWPDLSNAHEAYATAIAYDLTVIADFLERCVDRNALVIILGDHQPSPQITGPGKSRSVPIHIISGSTEMLLPFLKRGYTPGFIPDKPPPHPGMDTFLEGFLKDFSSR